MTESDEPFNNTMNNSDRCYYEQPPLTEMRFYLVTIFGSTVAFISILENALLFVMFVSRKKHRNSHNLYMLLLSFFDMFVSGAYILLMSMNILADYLESPKLINMWFQYTVPMLTISHIAMTSSTFLIVSASWERYCLTTNSPLLEFTQNNRKYIALSVVVFGILSKLTIIFEIEIVEIEDCAGTMNAHGMNYRPFVNDTPYNTIFRFWYRNVVTIFLPFVVLAYLNFRIVQSLSAHVAGSGVCMQLAGNIAMEQAKRKATARAATRTLVLVSGCYLTSNMLNVIITAFEHVDREYITSFQFLYAICIDLVSILTVLACFFRLPIYMACQPALRAEVLALMKTLWNSILCRRRRTDEDFSSRSAVTNTTTYFDTHNDSGLMSACNGKKKSLLSPSPCMKLHEPPPPGWAINANSSPQPGWAVNLSAPSTLGWKVNVTPSAPSLDCDADNLNAPPPPGWVIISNGHGNVNRPSKTHVAFVPHNGHNGVIPHGTSTFEHCAQLNLDELVDLKAADESETEDTEEIEIVFDCAKETLL